MRSVFVKEIKYKLKFGLLALFLVFIAYNHTSLTQTVKAENTIEINLGFQSQPTVEGLVLMGSRIYDPSLGRFLNSDPFSGLMAEPQGLNPYAYSKNDPINLWDPTGSYSTDTHYDKTLEWATSVAREVGFSERLANELADNIASFDQYHNKEWSLAPNNYSMGIGQGNSLHFMNPNRTYSDYGSPEVRNAIRNNGFLDFAMDGPVLTKNGILNPKKVKNTTIPVYEMRSLGDFNASQLIENPDSIHGEKIAELTLKGSTLGDRLENAITEHDPRLFGVAMHEYQDSFAHAGFNLWHGTSTDNDVYCNTYSSNRICDPNNIGDPIREQMIGQTPHWSLTEKRNDREALFQRDQLMRNGTIYWLDQFFKNQKLYFQDSINTESKTFNSFNKEEKVLTNASKRLKINEGFPTDIFIDQSSSVGKAPCINLFDAIDIHGFSASIDVNELRLKYPQCKTYFNDYNKRISR